MHFLLTNDDGIDAPGIEALERVCRNAGIASEISVVAPAEPASQIGHRVTTDSPIAVEALGPGKFAVSGTPADCVRLALTQLLERSPDYVISGINYGGNLGHHDFHISGTIAAAREAAFHGFSAAAVSHFHRSELDFSWETAESRTAEVLEQLLTEDLETGEFWNVNLPHMPPDTPEPQIHHCHLEPRPLPVAFNENGGGSFQYAGRYHERSHGDGSDVAVCFGGNISVSRCRIG